MEKQTANPSFIPRKERGLDSFRRTVRRSVRRGRSGGGPLGAVLRGVLVAASITVIGVAVFALILNWWNASDRALTAVNQVVKFVSILAGVTSAMRGGESGGVLRGASVGLLYMALGIVCYSLLMGESPRLTAYLADLGMGLAAVYLCAVSLSSGEYPFLYLGGIVWVLTNLCLPEPARQMEEREQAQ